MRICLSSMFNTIVADDLATQLAKASVGMLLTYLSQNLSVLAPEGLIGSVPW